MSKTPTRLLRQALNGFLLNNDKDVVRQVDVDVDADVDVDVGLNMRTVEDEVLAVDVDADADVDVDVDADADEVGNRSRSEFAMNCERQPCIRAEETSRALWCTSTPHRPRWCCTIIN